MKTFLLTAALTAGLAISATAANASASATGEWQRVDCGNTNATFVAFGSSSQICRTRIQQVCRFAPRTGERICHNVSERYCFQRPQIHPKSPFGKPRVRGRSRFQNR